MLHHGGELAAPAFGLAEVETLLDSSVRAPSIRLVRDGVPVPASVWTRRLRLGGVELTDVADGRRVLAAFVDGASVVLQGLHRTWPELAEFARRLERELGHPVQVNAYLTPPGSQALARHRDAHDVLVVQTHGSKAWTVEGLGDVTLVPGDVLYVPAGCHHEAAATEAVSLHLTIGVHRRTWRHAVEQVLRGVPALDAPLPIGGANGDPAQVAHELRRLVRHLAAHAEQLDDLALAAAAAGAAPRPARELRGSLTAIAAAAAAAPDDVVSLHPGTRVAVEAGWVTVSGPDRVLRVPLAAAAALAQLDGGAPRRVGDLAGLDPDSGVVLARRLVREGLGLVQRSAP